MRVARVGCEICESVVSDTIAQCRAMRGDSERMNPILFHIPVRTPHARRMFGEQKHKQINNIDNESVN